MDHREGLGFAASLPDLALVSALLWCAVAHLCCDIVVPVMGAYLRCCPGSRNVALAASGAAQLMQQQLSVCGGGGGSAACAVHALHVHCAKRLFWARCPQYRSGSSAIAVVWPRGWGGVVHCA